MAAFYCDRFCWNGFYILKLYGCWFIEELAKLFWFAKELNGLMLAIEFYGYCYCMLVLKGLWFTAAFCCELPNVTWDGIYEFYIDGCYCTG